jgi:hypothetical protein
MAMPRAGALLLPAAAAATMLLLCLAGGERDVRPPRRGHRRRAPCARLRLHPLPAEHTRRQSASLSLSPCSGTDTGVWSSAVQMWPGLIHKAKDGGLDVIETYVFWDIHEPVQG